MKKTKSLFWPGRSKEISSPDLELFLILKTFSMISIGDNVSAHHRPRYACHDSESKFMR